MSPACVELKLPLVKRNILIARLVASGAANNAGLDIESAEDVKVAVHEALIILLKEGYSEAVLRFFEGEGIRVEIGGGGDGALSPCGGSDISLLLMNELVDTVEKAGENGVIRSIALTKRI